MIDRTASARVAEAFAAALDTPEDERGAVLAALVPEPEARAEVERLLRRHASLEATDADFLGQIDAVSAGALLGSATPVPATIGRYPVARELARGGYGVVYLARDPELDRPVAIKVLPPERIRSSAARDRLKAEARVVSALDHPHIATIHEIGQTDSGELHIVMAYYVGETLRQRLGAGALPVSEAIRIAAELADALAAAHDRAIVHRDVKPENVILTERGVRLVDFGIATTVESPASAPGAAGTLAYMSPEQSRGEPPDPRADVWALGVVAYEMLTGRRPFAAQSRAALIDEIRTAAPPPIRRLRPEVPERHARMVHACLEKDPALRPGAALLHRELSRHRERRPAAILAFALPLLAALGVAFALLRPGAPVAPAGGTADPIAESLYVQGMTLAQRNTTDDLEHAAVLFRTAIERDSMFARGYSGLARILRQSRTSRPGDVYARMRPLLRRAAALDPTLADVQADLGWIAMWYDRDWATAEGYLRRALALDPNDPWMYHTYAGWLSAVGRIEEAAELERQAMVVDPRGAFTATHVAMHLTRQGKNDEAIALLKRALTIDSTWARTHAVLGRAYLAVGRYDEALLELRRDNYEFAGFDPAAMLAYGLALAGQRDEAERITADFELRARAGYANPVDLITCYIGLGDIERALEWTERIPDEPGVLFFARSDPLFEPLFREPRFQRVLERIGLDSASVARLPETRAAIDSILRPRG